VGWLVAGVLSIALVTTLLLVFLTPAVVPGSLSLNEQHRLDAEAAVRATILQTIGGLVVLVGLSLTARSVYLARETHVTDRLTKAVDQLGHDKPEVRVGGVYALQRLANNSPIDRGMIASILKGYLTARATGSTPIGPDIQTALNVLIELHG
jgi:hypothetical protein